MRYDQRLARFRALWRKPYAPYFLLMVPLNGILGMGLHDWAAVMRDLFDGSLEAGAVSPAADLVLAYPFWPWAFMIGFYVVGVLITRDKLSPPVGVHVLVVGLIVELFLLFFTLIFTAFPVMAVINRLAE